MKLHPTIILPTAIQANNGAGQVQLVRPRTIVVGDALTANEAVEIIAVTDMDYPVPT